VNENGWGEGRDIWEERGNHWSSLGAIVFINDHCILQSMLLKSIPGTTLKVTSRQGMLKDHTKRKT